MTDEATSNEDNAKLEEVELCERNSESQRKGTLEFRSVHENVWSHEFPQTLEELETVT